RSPPWAPNRFLIYWKFPRRNRDKILEVLALRKALKTKSPRAAARGLCCFDDRLRSLTLPALTTYHSPLTLLNTYPRSRRQRASSHLWESRPPGRRWSITIRPRWPRF